MSETHSVKNRGVILVVLLLAAGLAAATIAIWHQYRQTRHALRFWGAETADSIGNAPTVELTELHRSEADKTGSSDERQAEQRTIDISQAKGLVHFRRSLLEDRNFDWDIDAPAVTDEWDYAARFSNDEGHVELLFDLDHRAVARRAAGSDPATINARMAEGLAQFFEETLAQAVE